jgi:adenylylsulfate kinase
MWHDGKVTYKDRCKNLAQRGVVVWFTGLSGSGKSTIAVEVEKELLKQGKAVYRLDGDNVRHGLNSDLGFSKEDRDKNISRNSFVAKLLTDNDIVALCSFISPYKKTRGEVRGYIGDFIEVYVNAPLEVCEERDVKGLYQQARDGKIANFTGISDPYQPPHDPEIELRTDKEDVTESAARVIDYLEKNNYLVSEKSYVKQ